MSTDEFIRVTERLKRIEFIKSEIARANKVMGKNEENSKNRFMIQFRKEYQDELDALNVKGESQ